jgi:hypothetical protein
MDWCDVVTPVLGAGGAVQLGAAYRAAAADDDCAHPRGGRYARTRKGNIVRR